VKSIRDQIKKLQSFKNFKNAIFVKSAILVIYFAPGGFQCTEKGIFIPKDLKLGEISIKKHLKIFNFSQKLKEWGGGIRSYFFLLFEIQYLGNLKS